MNSDVAQPLPGEFVSIETNPWTEPFWEATKDNRLVIPQCRNCGTFRLPPHPFCAECLSQDTDYPEVPGTGTVYSFAICHKSPFPGVDDFTYVPAIVDVDGAPGVRIVTNIVGLPALEVVIGLPVEVDFSPINGGWKWPIFRRAGSDS